MSNPASFTAALAMMPVIAILRGLKPDEAEGIGDALYDAGIRIVEVPLNSPDPVASIRRLVSHLGDRCVIGAGTVLSARDVDAVVDVGGTLIVSPNTDRDVIARARLRGCVSIPGVGTATEALFAYSQGARYLKLFPAGTYGPSHATALKAVLPEDAELLGVGGIGAPTVGQWLSAGLCGVGIGSEIYRAGDTPASTRDKASAVVDAVGRCA